MDRRSPGRVHKKHRSYKNRDRSRSPLNKHSSKSNKNELSDEDREKDDSRFDLSLSVKETNVLRAKLGLAPLETNEKGDSSVDHIVDNQSQNFVHAPAKDLKKIRIEDELKEKIAVKRDKRKFGEKFESEKLSEPSEQYTDVQSWVEKMKEKERSKKQAAERAKLLSELDEQFDVTVLVQNDLKKRAGSKYTQGDLTGLTVEHNVDSFPEGKSVILTIKDKDILDESDGNVLVNVNIVDDEKAELNRETLRKTAGLGGIDDFVDEDVLMGIRAAPLLGKYDREIDGVQKSKFTLGADGSYSTENERVLKQLEAELKQGRQSLADNELRLTSEYYSVDEMKAKFKKRKRRAKTVRLQHLTADELASMVEDETNIGENDLGNRDSRHVKESGESSSIVPALSNDGDILSVDDQWDDLPSEDWSSVKLEEPDEFRSEIENTINRVIKSKSMQQIKPEEIALRLISQNSVKPEESGEPSSSLLVLNDEEDNTKNKIIFDSTTEFYKSIGIGFHESMQRNARRTQLDENGDGEVEGPRRLPVVKGYVVQEDDQSMDTEVNASNRWQGIGNESVSNNDSGGVQSPHSLENGLKVDEKSDIIQGVLDDEPRLDVGLVSALRLAEKKGYVEKSTDKQFGLGTMVNLMAKHFVQEENRYDDIDAKFSKRDRHSGPVSLFTEMRYYKPDVKLEYVDDLGRELNAKEAFRQLSHKFHGKGSGKNKLQKRMEKIKEEFLLKASTSSDTPLGTAEKLNKKLQSISLPYVILSGKNAAVKKLAK